MRRLQADPAYIAWRASRDRRRARNKLGGLFRQLPAVAVLLLILASGLATAWLTSYQLPISFESLKPKGLFSLRSSVTELYRTPSTATPVYEPSRAAAQQPDQDAPNIFVTSNIAPAQDPSLRALQDGARSLQASSNQLNKLFHHTTSRPLEHAIPAPVASLTQEAAHRQQPVHASATPAASLDHSQQLTQQVKGGQQAAGHLAASASASARRGSQAASHSLHSSVHATASALHATGSSFKHASRKAIALQDLPGNLAAQVAYRAAYLYYISKHELLARADAAFAWSTGIMHHLWHHVSSAWQDLRQYIETVLRHPPKPLHTAWSFSTDLLRQVDASCKQSWAWQWLARNAPSLRNATTRPQWTKDILQASNWQPNQVLARFQVAQSDARRSLLSYAHFCMAQFARAYRTGVHHLWHGVTTIVRVAKEGPQQLQRMSPIIISGGPASSSLTTIGTRLSKAGTRAARAGQQWLQAVAHRCRRDLSQGGPLKPLGRFKQAVRPVWKVCNLSSWLPAALRWQTPDMRRAV